jgi:hypothetical protein
MPERRDLFGECNVGGHPIDDFTRDCCANCINPECTRSLAGKAKFDDRTRNWFDRYFGDKDRMDPNDPRFLKIAAQKFIFIDPGQGGIVPAVGSAWLDPRDIEQAAPPPAPPPPAPAEPMRATTAPAQTSAPQISAPQPAAPAPAPPPAARPAAPPKTIPHHLLLANPAPPGGLMIPRPPSANPAPSAPKDPWAAPAPADPQSDAPVVSPGARVKMGGGGV